MPSWTGEPVDRTCIWLLFPYHEYGSYVDVRALPAYRPVHEAAMRHCVTLDRRNLGAPLHTPDVVETKEAGRRVLTCGETRIVAGERRLLCSEEAIEAWLSLPVERDEARLHAALEAQLEKYLAEKADFPEDLGAMMLCLGEPIGPLYGSAQLEEFAIASMTMDEPIRRWLDAVQERLRIVYTWCLERELADVYFLVGSELAAPPLVGLETFRRWIVPYAKDLIDLVHSYGKRVIQHFHGQIRDLLPDFVAMGPDALHTIEAPPVGNCTLGQAYDAVGDTMALIGNIQYDEFRAMTPQQMTRAVHDVLDEVAGRRFILSPTAGPFDPEPSERLIENYLAFIEAGRQR